MLSLGGLCGAMPASNCINNSTELVDMDSVLSGLLVGIQEHHEAGVSTF